MVTGVRYFNLFDMMADAVITAMAVMGHENIPLVVAETGWPSGGGEAGEVEANVVYAEMYLKGLVRHLKSGWNAIEERRSGGGLCLCVDGL